MRFVVPAAALVLCLAAAAHAEKPKAAPAPLQKVHVDTGFIDDAVALSADGQQLAYVHSNNETLSLVVAKVAGGTPVRVPLTGLPPIVARLAFAADGQHLLVVGDDRERDARVARVFTVDGKAVKGHLGPAVGFALGTYQGTPVVTALQIKRGKNTTTFTFTAYRLADLRLQKRKSYTTDAQGLLKGLEMKVVSYAADYQRLVGQKKGEYDKKNDIRKPENISILETLTGKILDSTEISDPMAWAEIANLRRARPRAEAFVFVEELKTLVLVGRDQRRSAVTLPEKLYKYEPKTLQQQVAGNTLYFTLAVDPVNPDATARHKSDPPDVDLYALDLGTRAVRRIWRLSCDRPVKWHLADGRIVILKKYKNFSRGGLDLEVRPLQ
jgi:hypothetical protein